MPTSGHAQFFKITFHSFPTHNRIATCGNGRESQPSRHSLKVQVCDTVLLAAFFDRYPHSKIKNRNRLFLSEMVSGTGGGLDISAR